MSLTTHHDEALTEEAAAKAAAATAVALQKKQEARAAKTYSFTRKTILIRSAEGTSVSLCACERVTSDF